MKPRLINVSLKSDVFNDPNKVIWDLLDIQKFDRQVFKGVRLLVDSGFTGT